MTCFFVLNHRISPTMPMLSSSPLKVAARPSARHHFAGAALLLSVLGVSSANAQNAFITNTADNTVSIIDVPSGAVIGAVPVGLEPQGVSVAPNGTTTYVTNLFGPSVSVIDAAQFPQKVTATIGSNFVGKALSASALVSSVLPGGRSVQVGTTATVFATIINVGDTALSNCQILLPTSAPAGMSMTYATTNPATNAVNSGPNPLVTIAGNDGIQTFVLAFQSTAAALDPSQPLLYGCDGTTDASIDIGVNTVDLQFSATPIPDIIALAATVSNDGVVTVPLSEQQEGAFAVASVNVGAAAAITVTADTGAAALPINITLCQTNAEAQCLAAPAPSVTLSYATNATPTFSLFVQATGAVPFAPGTSRIFVRFLDGGGVSHGSTSVAVETD